MADVTLSLLVLPSDDLARSVRFYNALGLNFAEEQHGRGPIHYACEVGDTVVELYANRSTPLSVTTRLGFRVASVDETVGKLRKIGTPVISEPADSPWGRRAVVADPDGHRVELTQESD